MFRSFIKVLEVADAESNQAVQFVKIADICSVEHLDAGICNIKTSNGDTFQVVHTADEVMAFIMKRETLSIKRMGQELPELWGDVIVALGLSD